MEEEKQELIQKFLELQDNILDGYNNQKISKKEMQNIIRWCEKQKTKLEIR